MKRVATVGLTLVVLALTVVLLAWTLAQVAEHPGIPREIGAPPTWFAASSTPSQPTDTQAPLPQEPETATPESGTDYVRVEGNEIKIALQEYELVPNKIMVRPGSYTFVLSNEGRFSHDFQVQGPGAVHGSHASYPVDAHAAKFAPGRTVSLEVTFTLEGQYHIMCPLSNHDERGMNGIVTVLSEFPEK